MTDELLPCPFCGAEDIALFEIKRRAGDAHYGWWSFCRGCATESPRKNKRKEAIMWWNTRHTPEGFVLVRKQLADDFKCDHQALSSLLTDAGIRAAYEYLIKAGG